MNNQSKEKIIKDNKTKKTKTKSAKALSPEMPAKIKKSQAVKKSVKKSTSSTVTQPPLSVEKLPEAIPEIVEPSQSCCQKISYQLENYNTLPYFKTFRGLAFLLTLIIAIVTALVAFWGDDIDLYYGLSIILPVVYLVYRSYRWSYLLALLWWSLEKITQILYADEFSMIVSALLWWGIGFWVYYRAFAVENLRIKEQRIAGISFRKWPPVRDILLSIVIFFLTVLTVSFCLYV